MWQEISISIFKNRSINQIPQNHGTTKKKQAQQFSDHFIRFSHSDDHYLFYTRNVFSDSL